ncbi:hypothetical protein MRBLRH8O_001501 [Agrobacterium radiobacter]|uniref:hypothetical protein n=1 Tax=Agrobacterium radiobacter TaxID=362 RepID=UPI003464E9AD
MSFMYLAVEDELSEVVGIRIVREYLGNDVSIKVLRKNGFGYLKSKIANFAEISERYAVFMITDLDRENCAPSLKLKWFNGLQLPENLIFRVAVKEIEAWLLADAPQLSHFLGIQQRAIPRNVETIEDPKAALVDVAKRAKRNLRMDIVPDSQTKAKQGLGYNRALRPFVESNWDVNYAAQNSDSLRRACLRVAELAERI